MHPSGGTEAAPAGEIAASDLADAGSGTGGRQGAARAIGERDADPGRRPDQQQRDAEDYAATEREVREWVQVVVAEAAGFTREEKRRTLRALRAQVTVWRGDYVHPDGWPQCYKIVLHFTGFGGQRPVTLPPSRIVSQAS
jgi:hypothetical protein